MILKHLLLQNFRSYTKATFSFDEHLTVIVGPNAIGKSNLVEAITLLSTGKSFRTSKEKQLITLGKTIARIEGKITDGSELTELTVMVTDMPGQMPKKYMVNGISKRRSALVGLLPTVLFTPLDLAIVSGQPGDKRRYLDEVLEQTDQEYASALHLYTKALRQRNALLEFVQNSGRRDEERFAYWDNLLITNGRIITERREAFIGYINLREKELFPFTLVYDKSLMSRERLLQYKDAEAGAGMTLVGPQRDDIIIQSHHPVSNDLEDVKYFCSRGQQRLVTLELKNAQISYLQEQLHQQPLLVLDDIFSELDNEHIKHVLGLVRDFQTIITTTHEEFVSSVIGKEKAVIELDNSLIR
ncbi:MAG TPA: DNA replication and repair protein RecF [Candidatus Acidoferrales bacterium]|nr:DNA replication and repair protein RecF [Candidatus Acidoferrales bacterium]